MNTQRIGMLTPSSNTVLEPVTQQIVSALSGVSAHFSRFPVTEISLSQQALAQFEIEPFMSSARLLADAKMDVIAWNGTSAAWRGFHEDHDLCAEIEARYGIAATASMMALNLVLKAGGVTNIGLVTPYVSDVQSAIVDNYTNAGFVIDAERHLGISVNFDFSQVAEQAIADMVLEVAKSQPAAIIIICTNLPAATLIDNLEQQTGIPIYDSTSAVVWHSLRLIGVDTAALTQWGSLFTNPGLQNIVDA